MQTIVRNDTLPMIAPGQVFKTRYLEPHGITVTKAAEKLHISRKQLSLFVNGHSSVTTELALKLEKGTGISADFWLNRQKKYDLYLMRNKEIQAEPLYAFG